MNLPPVILASASPRRAELLKQLHPDFRVVASDAVELHASDFTAHELAKVNAYRKARSVAARFPGALTLGADTLVCMGSELFGKPRDSADAHRMLSRLQGQSHQVVTGVCLASCHPHRLRVFAECTEVRFRPLSPVQINEYLASVNPLDKAGAYAIQEHGDLLVEEIFGSYSNVVGLPLERLEIELRKWA